MYCAVHSAPRLDQPKITIRQDTILTPSTRQGLIFVSLFSQPNPMPMSFGPVDCQQNPSYLQYGGTKTEFQYSPPAKGVDCLASVLEVKLFKAWLPTNPYPYIHRRKGRQLNMYTFVSR